MRQLVAEFEKQCNTWNGQLASLTNHLADYSAIFNERLLKQDADDIRYILIGDNPGREERKLREYFVGGAGMTARIFFERYLVKDFDKQVLCLNKTPIHTNATHQLQDLLKYQPNIIKDTQIFMANLAYNLHDALDKPVIVCGFGGCRGGGRWPINSTQPKIGTYFFAQLKESFRDSPEHLYMIKHFSHDKFFEDFDIQKYWNDPEYSFWAIGRQYRRELFSR